MAEFFLEYITRVREQNPNECMTIMGDLNGKHESTGQQLGQHNARGQYLHPRMTELGFCLLNERDCENQVTYKQGESQGIIDWAYNYMPPERTEQRVEMNILDRHEFEDHCPIQVTQRMVQQTYQKEVIWKR